MAKGICMCCLEMEVEAYEAGMRSAILCGVSAPTREWRACADHSERLQMRSWRALYERLQLKLAFPEPRTKQIPER